ncbi:hypothetical protein [Nocardia sp. CC201C]|uniref:hypothetical protein n=1 Tax=Nocardia sp. CC201C TaxID=3044575 RepID=UPI0024A898F2|nr:hypothetical protein [Nocardia sp. CC201C]
MSHPTPPRPEATPDGPPVRLRSGNPLRPADFVVITPDGGVHFCHREDKPLPEAIRAWVPAATPAGLMRTTPGGAYMIRVWTTPGSDGPHNRFAARALARLGFGSTDRRPGTVAISGARDDADLGPDIQREIVAQMDYERRREDAEITAALAADPAAVAVAREWLARTNSRTAAEVARLSPEAVIATTDQAYGLYRFLREAAADITARRTEDTTP